MAPEPQQSVTSIYQSGHIRVGAGPAGSDFERADIVFDGVEQAGGSFEARVFLNNPSADATTPKTPEHGYAGAFHVYGYGLWPGGECEVFTSEGARAPMTRSVIATDAVRAALEQGDEVEVTTVVVPSGGGTAAPGSLDPERVSIRLDAPPG